MDQLRTGIAERPAGPSRDAFRWAYLTGLAIVAIGMPWGEFLMSFGQIVLLTAWLWEGLSRGTLRARSGRVFRDPAVLVYLSFFGIHLLGLAWTADLKWGLDLCRILLPALILPIVIAGQEPLRSEELRGLLSLFAASVVLSTVVCLIMVADLSHYRALSCFISHIRLALMLCMCVFVLVRFWPRVVGLATLHAIGIGWCVVYLQWLGSIAGWFIVLSVGAWSVWRWSRQLASGAKWAVRSALLAVPVAAFAFVSSTVREAVRVEASELGPLASVTLGGEPYAHDTTDLQLENGRYVWRNIAWAELHREWSKRSPLGLDTPDGEGHPIYGSLFRYMTSRGLRKDSVGLAALSDEEITRIAQGTAMLGRGSRLTERLREFAFEVQRYRNTGDASGYSLAMRLEFWKAALNIIAQHPVVGVGTGDTQLAFNAEYERMQSKLAPQWRLRAHHQYLTWAVSFGLGGALLCLLAWAYPVWRRRTFRDVLFVAWAFTALVSGLLEDTLETQAGITFVAFFYCLFVFGSLRPEGKRQSS